MFLADVDLSENLALLAAVVSLALEAVEHVLNKATRAGVLSAVRTVSLGCEL